MIKKSRAGTVLRLLLASALLFTGAVSGSGSKVMYAAEPEAEASALLEGDTVQTQLAEPGEAPNEVRFLSWELLAYNRIQLTWEAPEPVPEESPPVVEYQVFLLKNKVWEIVGETTDTRYVADHLEPARIYRYKVNAVNEEGTSSADEHVSTGTSPAYMVTVANLPDLAQVDDRYLAFSGDGRQAAASAKGGHPLYAIDIAGKTAEPLPIVKDGGVPKAPRFASTRTASCSAPRRQPHTACGA